MQTYITLTAPRGVTESSLPGLVLGWQDQTDARLSGCGVQDEMSSHCRARRPCPQTWYRLRWLPTAWRHVPGWPGCGRLRQRGPLRGLLAEKYGLISQGLDWCQT